MRAVSMKLEIEVTDLLLVGTRRAVGRFAAFSTSCAHIGLRLIVEHRESAVVGTVGRNHRRLEPVAAHVAEQVILGPQAAIESLPARGQSRGLAGDAEAVGAGVSGAAAQAVKEAARIVIASRFIWVRAWDSSRRPERPPAG